MTEIQDQMVAAIQAYAITIPNEEFKLNLLAVAEHMAPELIASLGLRQEWGLTSVWKSADGDEEEIDEVRCLSDEASYPFNLLEHQREHDGIDDETSRTFVATRCFTDWAEVHPIVLNADEQKQMDIDQATIPG